MIKDRYMRLKNKAISSSAINSADNTSSRWAMKKNITLSSQAAKAETRQHKHAFSQEHFVGPELFSKVIRK